MDDATTEDAKIRMDSGGGGRSKEGEEEEDGKSENRRILDSEIRGKGNYNGDGEAEAMGNKVTYSQALEAVGSFGRYQYWLILQCSLLWALNGVAVVVWAFGAFPVSHRCATEAACEPDPQSAVYGDQRFKGLFPSTGSVETRDECLFYKWKNESDRLGSTCEAYIEAIKMNDSRLYVAECPHSSLVFDRSVVSSSLVEDFDFLCDKTEGRAYLGTAYMWGMLVGALLVGYVSDHFGRLKATALTALLAGLSGACAALSSGWPSFAASRVVTGASVLGFYMSTFVLVVETVGPQYKAIVGVLAGVPYAVGLLLFTLAAYFVRDWRTLHLVSYSPFLIALPMLYLMQESPRWLLATGKTDRALKGIARVARANGKPDSIVKDMDIVILKDKKTYMENLSSSSGLLPLLHDRRMLLRLLGMSYQWLSVALCYFGLLFASATSLTGDPYLNFALGAVSEIPGYLFAAFEMDSWGRRPILVFLQLFPGLSCIAAGLMYGVEELRFPQLILTMFGKFGSAGCFNMVYVYTAELFPTGNRNSAIGFCSMTARLGTILSMLVDLLGLLWGPAPMVTLGAVSTVAGILAFAFPETSGLPMPDTVDEAVRLGEDGSEPLCSCYCTRSPFARKELEKNEEELQMQS